MLRNLAPLLFLLFSGSCGAGRSEEYFKLCLNDNVYHIDDRSGVSLIMDEGRFSLRDGSYVTSGRYALERPDGPGYMDGAIYVIFIADPSAEGALVQRMSSPEGDIEKRISEIHSGKEVELPAIRVNDRPFIIMNYDLDDTNFSFVGIPCAAMASRR